ncbi:Cytochrome P450 protein [Rutstroemia sp. NJR-2017a BBW]|nr:Cytochrome P450 protein [Rutstroemia sp. NJR-2017a BBW]
MVYWLSSFVCVASLGFFTLAIFRLKLHSLSAIPGPSTWILSRLPYARALRKGDLVHRIVELHETYGPVVRIASNEVSFSDERAWNSIYAPYRKTLNLPKSPFWYQPRINNGSYGIMAAPPAEHGRFRRVFAPAFSEKSMLEHEPMIIQYADMLVSQLKAEASKKAAVDIVDWFEYAAFDIVGDLAFSKPFHTLENDEFRYLVHALRKFLHAFTQAVVPRVLGLEILWRLIVPRLSRQKQMAYNKSLNYFTHQRQSQGETPGKNDLMTYFTERGDGKGLSIVETENAIGDIMIAGSETVASTLSAVCHHIVKNSGAYEQLVEEIRGGFEREKDITASATAELPFLNAVINEAMRLCPSLPAVMPRIVTEPGMEVCNHWLPAGTLVTFCQLAAYTSANNFASPKEFIPARWLPGSDIEPHNANVFYPFSVGPRDCVGKTFALAEVRLILAKLLWNFDLRLGEKEWDWYSQKAFLVWDKQPLYLELSVESRYRLNGSYTNGHSIYELYHSI